MFRVLAFSLSWIVFVNGALNSWVIGIPTVIIAASISMKLLPSIPVSFIGLVKFIPFFLWYSLLGGFDVAKRVFFPKVTISPAILHYRWRLPLGLSRVFMANTVSLLPGTLSVELDKEYLQIHVLDESIDFDAELILVENKVAELFKLNLSASEYVEFYG